jgi:1-acyl-sn-glycerol-3-phosphate acyltransferase
MKNIFNSLLRRAIWLALHIYFKKIRVYGKENLPKGKAVLIVANHQNALIDPLLIATHTRLKPYFLARASVFKNPIAAELLDFIRMIPIYRIRDGINNMDKNKETFEKSADILASHGSILIFGEGNHDLHRSLRPLKKGFARIAFKTLEEHPELDLLILPIGLNFSNHMKSGSKVSLYIGEAFSANTYYPNNSEGILKAATERLKPLVTHIPKENYRQWLEELKQYKVDITDPAQVSKFIEEQELSNKQDPPFSPYFTNKVMKVFHFPVYWIWLWISTKIEDTTFTATFKFVIGLVFIPLWYIFLIMGMPALGWGPWVLPWVFLGVLYLLSNTTDQA